MMKYYTDGCRHLVCVPYSVENLHAMAENLGIKRGWFHKDHYDIPKRRIAEIEDRCYMVSSREIVRIIKGTSIIGRFLSLKRDYYLYGFTVAPEGWNVEVLWVRSDNLMAEVQIDVYQLTLSSLDEDCTWDFEVRLEDLMFEEGDEDAV
jgi:hypothetical protein